MTLWQTEPVLIWHAAKVSGVFLLKSLSSTIGHLDYFPVSLIVLIGLNDKRGGNILEFIPVSFNFDDLSVTNLYYVFSN